MISNKVYHTIVFGGHKLLKLLLYLPTSSVITIVVKNNVLLNN